MNKDTHADSGQSKSSDGGQGSIQGRYYPRNKAQGGPQGWTKTNDPWRPTESGKAVPRDSNGGTNRKFVHGGGEYGSGGTRSSPKSSMFPNPSGADGPDGSGGGTTHTKSDWFATNKNCGSSNAQGSAGKPSKGTAYGSGDYGKGKTGKA